MNDLAQFRKDLAAWMKKAGVNQVSLANASGVDQASLSRFLRTKKEPDGLSGKSILRLYPFVYGDRYPADSAAPPAEPVTDCCRLPETK